MEDLDELKGRVERATRALTEREAEEQSRHSQLVSLMAALEARSLEAREATERAEALLAAAEAENEELRGLLVGLLDAVEIGSRSRFADAIYALEARIAPGHSAHAEAPDASTAPEPEGDAPAVAAPEHDASEHDTSEHDTPVEDTPGEHADDFTARLAAGCAVEDQLAQEAEALRAAADARSLLDRIRREADRSGDAGVEGAASAAAEAVPDDADDMPAAGFADLRDPTTPGATSIAEMPAEGPLDGEQPVGEQPGETADPAAEEDGWRGRRQAAS